ncbi:translation initiation factor IF-2-like [Penaeus monodon]|uniref:translation initiation factor IF-2-like n=1 Tax=Penaeus monodon TaxID=6687 RepID=UPI0018A72409|nr:translation initiation factor IF-2-like [Penaeus monodon]
MVITFGMTGSLFTAASGGPPERKERPRSPSPGGAGPERGPTNPTGGVTSPQGRRHTSHGRRNAAQRTWSRVPVILITSNANEQNPTRGPTEREGHAVQRRGGPVGHARAASRRASGPCPGSVAEGQWAMPGQRRGGPVGHARAASRRASGPCPGSVAEGQWAMPGQRRGGPVGHARAWPHAPGPMPHAPRPMPQAPGPMPQAPRPMPSPPAVKEEA